MKTTRTIAQSFLPLIIFGLLSAVAYFFLYKYSNMTIELSERVHNGEKMFALAPIGIAFTFSFIHGNFTAHFWDRLGFKPKSK